MDPQNWRPDWIFAITTLLIRFFGIFVVLGILQIALQITDYIFRRLTKKSAEKTPQVPSEPTSLETITFREEASEPELAAAIGAALSLYESEAETAATFLIGEGPTSPSSGWAVMGRMAQLQSRVFQR